MIIDAPEDCSAAAQALFDSGVRTVIRYYDKGHHPRFPTKLLTKAEMEALQTAGLGISVVYEDISDHLAYFQDANVAAADATYTLHYADNVVGQAHGSSIFFSVDIPPSDLTDAEIDQYIIPYFQTINAVNAAQGGNYKIGAYAAGNICEKLLQQGLIEYSWYVATWDPGHAFENSGLWNLRQNVGEHTIANISCDINTINPNKPYIGHF